MATWRAEEDRKELDAHKVTGAGQSDETEEYVAAGQDRRRIYMISQSMPNVNNKNNQKESIFISLPQAKKHPFACPAVGSIVRVHGIGWSRIEIASNLRALSGHVMCSSQGFRLSPSSN